MTRQDMLSELDMCPRCACCGMETMECWKCGGEGGTEPGELYELDPLWYLPGDTETCDICSGRGSWPACGGDCDSDGKHARPDSGETAR